MLIGSITTIALKAHFTITQTILFPSHQFYLSKRHLVVVFYFFFFFVFLFTLASYCFDVCVCFTFFSSIFFITAKNLTVLYQFSFPSLPATFFLNIFSFIPHVIYCFFFVSSFFLLQYHEHSTKKNDPPHYTNNMTYDRFKKQCVFDIRYKWNWTEIIDHQSCCAL